eukprot:s1798_g6.t1
MPRSRDWRRKGETSSEERHETKASVRTFVLAWAKEGDYKGKVCRVEEGVERWRWDTSGDCPQPGEEDQQRQAQQENAARVAHLPPLQAAAQLLSEGLGRARQPPANTTLAAWCEYVQSQVESRADKQPQEFKFYVFQHEATWVPLNFFRRSDEEIRAAEGCCLLASANQMAHLKLVLQVLERAGLPAVPVAFMWVPTESQASWTSGILTWLQTVYDETGIEMWKRIDSVVLDGVQSGAAAIRALLPKAFLGRDLRHVLAACKRLSHCDFPARGDFVASVVHFTASLASPGSLAQQSMMTVKPVPRTQAECDGLLREKASGPRKLPAKSAWLTLEFLEKKTAKRLADKKSLWAAAVVNAFKNWMSLTKSEKAERDREQILADQTKHWEAETDRLRNQFDKEMRGTMTEHERLKAQAQAQTELILRRWLSMNELDISEHFVMWRRYTAATKDSNRKRNAVKDAMSRFLEGERRGVMHSTFTGWKTHVAQAAKSNSQIRKLEEQVERLLRKQEQSVQKYGTFLASKSGPAMKGLVFRRWFELSQGEKQRAEFEREREVQLEEMARKHKMEETRKKEMRAKALHNLGVKGGRAVLLEVFLAWSYEYQKNKEVRCHKMNENEALMNYSKYILGKKLKEDSHALLASSFSEWRREGKILRHEDAMNTLEERDVYIAQLKAGFEEQLALAYQQIDQITETLQKELQTKEELAQELREAYEKNRKINLPDYPVTPGSATPGSTRRRQASTERRGTSVGSNVSRPARHSLPGSSLTKERETFLGGGLAQVSEPLAFQRPATTGHLQPPNGSASRSTSPRRDVNWDSVVDRLENRGVVAALARRVVAAVVIGSRSGDH